MSPTGEAVSQSGFSLIELMVTMALATTMLALVPPLLGQGGERARLDHDRRGLIDQFRLARSEAIAGDHEISIGFDLAHRRYGIGKPDQTIDAGVSVALETPLADSAEIRFYADGSASGGTIRLVNRSGSVALEVDWLTGGVAQLP